VQSCVVADANSGPCSRKLDHCYLVAGPTYGLLLPTLLLAFALQLVDLFRSYFEGALNENSVKRNFVLIYELLEETMDFGFPQLTGGWTAVCSAGALAARQFGPETPCVCSAARQPSLRHGSCQAAQLIDRRSRTVARVGGGTCTTSKYGG